MLGNQNIKAVGLFGQSGAGKTTVIRNVRNPVNGIPVGYNTGIIRYLFQKNGDYHSPNSLLRTHSEELNQLKGVDRDNKADEIMEKYVRSQLQLLNDFSTEVFLAVREPCSSPKYLLLDRSPLDFYALSVCGVKYLVDKLGKQPSDSVNTFLGLVKKTAELNTKNFFSAVVITKPWKSLPSNDDKDGVRDEYLNSYYTGDTWYERFADCDIGDCKVFTVPETLSDLMQRAKLVGDFLEEV